MECQQKSQFALMEFDFTTFPRIKTARLSLKEATLEDTESVFALRSSEDLNRYVATKKMQNLEEASDFIQNCNRLYKTNNRIFWLIWLDTKVVGSIVLHRIVLNAHYAEIGYQLKSKYQQKGYMSEALQAVIQFGFDRLNIKTIEAFTHRNNLPSITLLEKHHFVYQPKRIDAGFEKNCIFKLEKKASHFPKKE